MQRMVEIRWQCSNSQKFVNFNNFKIWIVNLRVTTYCCRVRSCTSLLHCHSLNMLVPSCRASFLASSLYPTQQTFPHRHQPCRHGGLRGSSPQICSFPPNLLLLDPSLQKILQTGLFNSYYFYDTRSNVSSCFPKCSLQPPKNNFLLSHFLPLPPPKKRNIGWLYMPDQHSTGGAVVGSRTCDRKVAGSTPGRGAIKSTKSTQPSIPPG